MAADPSTLFQRANDALDAARYDDAVAILTEAIDADPSNAALVQSRGTVYARKNDHTSAVADYTAAITLHPKYADAFLNRGLSHWEQGRYTQAALDLTKALDFGLRHDELAMQAQFFLARATEELGDHHEAYDAYLELAVLAPNGPYANECAERSLALVERVPALRNKSSRP